MTKAIIVTGAAGGIGSAVCARAQKDGYSVIGIDWQPIPAADTAIQIDLRDTESVLELSRELGHSHDVNAVVHCAATQPIAGAGDTAVEHWDEALRVNVIAVDVLVAGTRNSLAANDGSIVVVSSVHSRATSGGLTAYATTKAAVEGWVRSAALDLGPQIRVNAVAPGAIDTTKLREGFARWGTEAADQRMEVLCQRTALRRIGTPDEVAAAASFLIGRDARFITGAVLVVDGGASVRLGSE
ncbi:short-chain dehydrogenase [Mycolicibacterium elephantis]|uniref:Short-chain dehydrogenase n=1 Tax=Mycolicibacterium elephantis TaxID=81858 RepID=A0A1X0D999_9MYCO|nr:SDR family oxidoreductase [Mycolicibacterium elephantis]ORA68752.1 short-chain dehydrogenase [Mycolicibacterium elephantis]